MGKYSFIDHTADAGIEVQAADRAELFTLAARAMFSLICDVEAVRPEMKRGICVESGDAAGLLHEWLSELLYVFDTRLEIYTEFRFDFSADGRAVKAEARGEEVDADRHKIHGEVKNVTWCDYVVEKMPGGSFFARVVFDL